MSDTPTTDATDVTETTTKATEKIEASQTSEAATPAASGEPTLHRRLLDTLANSKTLIPQIADEMNITIEQMCELVHGSAMARQVDALRRIHSWREMLLSENWRNSSIWTLIDMTRNEKAGCETVRRACNDLLSLTPVPEPPRGREVDIDCDPGGEPQLIEEVFSYFNVVGEVPTTVNEPGDEPQVKEASDDQKQD